MVSKVFPDDELSDRTVEFARRIAKLPTVTALLIKESVNQTVDAMGFSTALDACFKIHQLNHAHWAEVTGGALSYGTVEYGLDDWRISPEILPASKSDPDRKADAAVDVDYPPEAEAFRDQDPRVSGRAPTRRAGPGPVHCRRGRAKGVHCSGGARTLADRGLVAVSWPKEYGGAGLSAIEQVVLAEEFARAGAPERDRERPARHRAAGQHADRAWFRGAEEALSPAHSVRRGPLVPGLLRARGGFGPGVACGPGLYSTATNG